MLYTKPEDWKNAKSKRVLLFGMSGLGKTYISNMLRANGDWFHYSIDYRIGTRYMGELISDSYKLAAMKTPYLGELLKTDSIYIESNITFDNLTPLSNYLGKPGNIELGGIPIAEYEKRQEQHRKAEIAALLDTGYFVSRSKEIYQYENFICDSGGSICEVVDPEDPKDPVMKHLSQNTLLVWIKGSEAHTEALIDRFDKNPKPMCYEKSFLATKWEEFIYFKNINANEVDPNEFIRWTYSKALSHRQPRYEKMSKWGITVKAEDIEQVKNTNQFNLLIENTLANL